jgi:type II secretory pathway predicted ATPase ExeA
LVRIFGDVVEYVAGCGSSAGAFVPQDLGQQVSSKQIRLKPQGVRKLEDALNMYFGTMPDHSKVARELLENVKLRETVAKVRDAREAVVRNSIERLFTALNLDLEPDDYESLEVKQIGRSTKKFPPNPFEQPGLWGCDELLRRIFEQLGKGGSQALIGPAGCGKSEILRTIVARESDLKRPVLSLDMHLVRDEQSFFARLCHCLELEAVKELSLVPMQVERELNRRKQAHVLCLDEIHVLTDEAFFPLATRNWLKGMTDAKYPLQLVVASQRELRDLFPDRTERNSPLADFFDPQTVRVDYWSLAAVRHFVEAHLSRTGVKFKSAQIEDLHEQGGGRPRDVRSAAAKLYDRLVSGVDQV